jgi:hypothetical protein
VRLPPHAGTAYAQDGPRRVAENPKTSALQRQKAGRLCMLSKADPDESSEQRHLAAIRALTWPFCRFATSCHQDSWKIRLRRRESPRRDVRKTTTEAGMLFKINELINDTFGHPDECLKTRELIEKAHEWFRMRWIAGICGQIARRFLTIPITC